MPVMGMHKREETNLVPTLARRAEILPSLRVSAIASIPESAQTFYSKLVAWRAYTMHVLYSSEYKSEEQ